MDSHDDRAWPSLRQAWPVGSGLQRKPWLHPHGHRAGPRPQALSWRNRFHVPRKLLCRTCQGLPGLATGRSATGDSRQGGLVGHLAGSQAASGQSVTVVQSLNPEVA